jgi:hypothetical protein
MNRMAKLALELAEALERGEHNENRNKHTSAEYGADT